MIIVRLIGGIGNQMFQYSLGRSISIKNKNILKLDITDYKNYKLRKYELGVFNIKEEFATEGEIRKLKINPSRNPIKFINFIEYIKPYYKRKYIKEVSPDYDPNLRNVTNNVYLDGYWQSEKYFIDFENIIKKDFEFKNKLEGLNKGIAKEIEKTNSVSIHFRRGDYVKNEKTRKIHGICNLDYYYKAIKIIANNVKKPHFFVFSDEPEWPEKNLKVNLPIKFISHNIGNNSYKDLELMKLCKHNIIANSSFSWWGAWLNNNPYKIVIAPKKWFKGRKTNINDRLPKSWIKI